MTAIQRRNFLAGLSAATLMLPGSSAAALLATPASTEGPFYPDRLPLDDDNDLTQVKGSDGRAAGRPFDLAGRVVSVSGAPVAGARVEIWQCDANGVYLHSSDSGRKTYDRNFQGFGRTLAAADGGYRFRTIVPVAYSGRTPHIHMKIVAPNRRELVTQMYIDGHARNANDFLFSRLGGASVQKAASVALRPSGNGEPSGVSGRFDIVLR